MGSDEEVSLMTIGGHGLSGAGLLVSTPARCLYGLRRFLFWHQIKDFAYEADLALEVKKSGRYYSLRFRTEETKPYAIMLGTVRVPTQEDVLRLVVAQAQTAGVPITSKDEFVLGLLGSRTAEDG